MARKRRFDLKKEDVKDLYTTKEIAQMLQVDTRTIRLYISDGKMRSVKIGNEHRIPMDFVMEFVHKSSSFIQDE